jgi:hypothetical protein
MKKHVDVVISAVEINDRHGVGVYLQRLFPQKEGVISLRSRSIYGGNVDFGEANFELNARWLRRSELQSEIDSLLGPYTIDRILCVPFFPEDFLLASYVKEHSGAPLCLYLMDDQNVFSKKVSNEDVANLWNVADVRLGISPEMCAAYARKYNGPIQCLPPLTAKVRKPVLNYWESSGDNDRICALVGNVWTAGQFLRLRRLVKSAGIRLEWYGAASRAGWLPGTAAEWEQDGIYCLGHLPDEDLAAALAGYLCVIIPSGDMDNNDDNLAFSRLSLPSRLIALSTLAATPQLVLGHEDTAAGRFVRTQGFGRCCRYTSTALRTALRHLASTAERQSTIQNIATAASKLAFPQARQWIWNGLQTGKVSPAEFQKLPAFAGRIDPSWLEKVEPVTLKDPAVRRPFRPKRPETWGSIAYLKRSHFEEYDLKMDPDHAELSQAMEAFAGAFLKHWLALTNKKSVLFLGTHKPAWHRTLPPRSKLWMIPNIEEWREAACKPLPNMRFVSTSHGRECSRLKFDIIVSQSWMDRIYKHDELQNLSDFLSSIANVGAANFHLWACRRTNRQLVAPPSYKYFQNRHTFVQTADASAGFADRIFFMNEQTYNMQWLSVFRQSYAQFGSPFCASAYWQDERLKITNILGLILNRAARRKDYA